MRAPGFNGARTPSAFLQPHRAHSARMPIGARQAPVRTPEPSRPWRVLIVDDQALIRYGIRELLRDEVLLEWCGEADSVDGALAKLGSSQPDLVITDLSLKGGGGLALVEAIRDHCPSVATLVWSMYDEKAFAASALRAGAGGYVSKAASGAELVQTALDILAGRAGAGASSSATSDARKTARARRQSK